jgi:peroxiredoxin Q/BCP
MPSTGYGRSVAQRVAWALWVGIAMMTGPGGIDAVAKDLTPGALAPDFTLPGSDGKTYRLSDLRGKQVVVIAWFPKAFTGG